MSEMVPIDPLHKPFSVQRFLVSITTAKSNFGSRHPLSSEGSFEAVELYVWHLFEQLAHVRTEEL